MISRISLKGTHVGKAFFSTGAVRDKVVVFGGHGTHMVGMGKQFLKYDWSKEFLKQCDERLGLPITKYMTEGPEDELNKTEIAQPAIFINSYLLFQKALIQGTLKEEEIEFVIGHSLGEYLALTVSESFVPLDAIKFLHERAKLVQDCCKGKNVGMIVVLGDYDQLELEMKAIELQFPDKMCDIAAFNSPNQFILTGELEVLLPLQEELQLRGIKTFRVNARAAFHSHLLTQMRGKLKDMLEDMNIFNPKYRIIRNCDTEEYCEKQDIIEGLVEQLDNPVLFHQMVEKIRSYGDYKFIEAGSNGNMPTILRSISRDINVVSLR
jgi:(acyl-carrier-protein) S-malonyltransferase